MKNLFVLLFLCCNFALFSQGAGHKAIYYDKKPASVEALIKNAEVFDTLTNSGIIVYKRTVKTKTGTEVQYFVIEQRLDEHAKIVYKRKRIYPEFKD